MQYHDNRYNEFYHYYYCFRYVLSLDLLFITLIIGHEIANHIWDHKVLTKIPLDSVYEQLKKTNNAIKKILNIEPKIMRPPYGNTNMKLNNYIQDKGNCLIC